MNTAQLNMQYASWDPDSEEAMRKVKIEDGRHRRVGDLRSRLEIYDQTAQVDVVASFNSLHDATCPRKGLQTIGFIVLMCSRISICGRQG